jgi:hypothetical protein
MCLRGQPREAPNRKDLAIGELAVTYHQRSAKTHLLLISVFLDVLLIRLVRDPMPPTIAQWRAFLMPRALFFRRKFASIVKLSEYNHLRVI